MKIKYKHAYTNLVSPWNQLNPSTSKYYLLHRYHDKSIHMQKIAQWQFKEIQTSLTGIRHSLIQNHCSN